MTLQCRPRDSFSKLEKMVRETIAIFKDYMKSTRVPNPFGARRKQKAHLRNEEIDKVDTVGDVLDQLFTKRSFALDVSDMVLSFAAIFKDISGTYLDGDPTTRIPTSVEFVICIMFSAITVYRTWRAGWGLYDNIIADHVTSWPFLFWFGAQL